MIFDRPQPGFSLTQEPKGAPFENPPEIVDPEEAAKFHLDNMNNANAFEDIAHFLESGLDIPTLVQGILRSAVFQGVHSIDVSLIIAPALHEFIKNFADEAGVDYDEGFTNEREEKALSYRRDVEAARKMLAEAKEEEEPKRDPLPVMMEEEQEPVQEEEPAKTGLMARM